NLSFSTQLTKLVNEYEKRGGFSVFYNDLKNKGIPEELQPDFLELSKKIRSTITIMPMKYIGRSISDDFYSIFQYENKRFPINFLVKDLVAISSNSKLKSTRTFKGFLINSYNPIMATLNGKKTTFNFTQGVFQFIYDFESFVPNENITIVGIENAENFRWIAKQQYLFEDIQPLFVSRYPQNQSKDLIKWLPIIANNYLHFGDFDFAGIGIYLNEYKKHLSEKAYFFVPNDIEKRLRLNGNSKLYDKQKMSFKEEV